MAVSPAVFHYEKHVSYIKKVASDVESLMGDEWGEVDTRYSCCALSGISILGNLQSGLINFDKSVEFVPR